jgi:uncharacterized cupin superfamily protein
MRQRLSIFVFIFLSLTIISLDGPDAIGAKVVSTPHPALLAKHDVFSWPTWEKEPSEFVWQFSEREIAYLLEGEVFVTPEGSKEVLHFKKGDIAYFDAGLRCKWHITKPVKKHVILEKNKLQEIYWKVVFKLQYITRWAKVLLGQSEHVFMEHALNT